MKLYNKSMRKILLSIFLLPFFAFAQNQGDDTPLGSGGQKIFCNSNTSLAAKVSATGKLNFIACDLAGAVYTITTDSVGNSLSTIPISSASELNGIGAGLFQWLDQASITATGGTTTSITTASTSGLRVNDICISRAGTATNLNAWSEVTAIVANTSITLGHALPSAPANADTFECFRSVPVIGNVGQGGTYRNSPYIQIDSNYQSAATTGLLKLEDTAGVTADAGVGALGVINTGVVSPAANGDYAFIALGAYGQAEASIIHDPNISAGSIATAQEDDAIANAKPVVMAGTINNRGLTTYNTTNGDAQFIGTGDYGNVMSTLFYDGAFAGGRSPIRLEDDPAASADAGMVGLSVRSDTLSGTQAANGDYESIYSDPDGRIYVNTSGTGPGSSFQSCGTATAVTSDVAMKAAVASNRMYVRAITCKNTSATVGTTLDFKDGTTVVAVGGITSVQATAPGSFVANFDPPLRGSVNTAFNFATNVAVSSATCCIAGYISTN